MTEQTKIEKLVDSMLDYALEEGDIDECVKAINCWMVYEQHCIQIAEYKKSVTVS